MTRRFHGNFTRQPPVPGEGVERAVAVMRSGRPHRYDVVDGEAPEIVLAAPAGNRNAPIDPERWSGVEHHVR